MKSTVDAKAFSAALDKVSKVLRKSAVPIIEQICVRFEEIGRASCRERV